MHFLGLKWHNEDRHPYMRFRNQSNQGEVERIEVKVNEYISISICKEKYCIGSDGLCPFNADLTGTDFIQCSSCGKKGSTYFLSLGGLDQGQVEYLKTLPHHNYITIFGDDVVKTGVAAVGRKYGRILDQGALAAIYLTDCDGYTARQIERYISTNLKVKQAIVWEAKVKLLGKQFSEEKAKSVLQEMYRHVVEILPAEYKVVLKKVPEFFINTYAMEAKRSHTAVSCNYFDKFQDHDVVSGTILGLQGSLLLLKNDEKLYVINMNGMSSHMIKVSKSSNAMKLSTQPKYIELVEKPPTEEVLSLF